MYYLLLFFFSIQLVTLLTNGDFRAMKIYIFPLSFLLLFSSGCNADNTVSQDHAVTEETSAATSNKEAIKQPETTSKKKDDKEAVKQPTNNARGDDSKRETDKQSTVVTKNDGGSFSVEGFLGEKIMWVLKKPDSAQIFELIPELPETDLPENKQLGGFPIKKLGPILKTKQVDGFQKLFFNKKSYMFDLDKRCVMRPTYGLLFKRETSSVEVLLSIDTCPKWSFIHQKDEKTQDCDEATSQLRIIVDELFPVVSSD